MDYHRQGARGRLWREGCRAQHKTSKVRIYVYVLSRQGGRRGGGNLRQVQSVDESGVYRMCSGSNKCAGAVLEGVGVRLETVQDCHILRRQLITL